MNDASPTPSLLDWLKAQWSQPLIQRVFRFGAAALTGGWGLYLWLADGNGAGYFFIGLGLGLALWGLSVRGANTWTLSPGGLPAVETRPLVSAPAATRPAASFLAPLRLPAAFVFPLLGQIVLSSQRENVLLGLVFYALGVAAFGLVVWREGLLARAPQGEQAAPRPVAFRLGLLGAAALAGLIAFATSGGNRFTTFNVAAWLAAVAAWLAATLTFGRVGERLAGAWERLWAGGLTLRITWLGLALTAILAVGAYFRLAGIDAIPPEMTSDHAEKILDVYDLAVDGQTKIFFERNTGREPLQFYWTAWIGALFGTGVSYLSLKIGTGLIGWLTLPYVFLLARELEDDAFALLATLLAAFSFWATAISRVGLRFPLYPAFVAPALFHLFRGLRRGTRNDYLWAGLFLGLGLYGYSPIRALPLAIAAIVGWYLLWPEARGRRLDVLANTGLLFATTVFVFLPLLRYSLDRPDMFWYRTLSRLGDTESRIVGSPLLIFLQNNWNALRAFNWLGDSVWVNSLPGRPLLDVVSAALLILGAAYVLARLILRRDWVAGALLLTVPVLLLPSTLALAFPNENPSAVRMGGAIPVIFVLAAYPLWLLIRRIRLAQLGAPGVGAAAVTLAALLGGAFALNRQMYFQEYPAQYVGPAQNASEIGQVIHDFARTFGDFDTAWVRPYPHWVDTRAVGMYADQSQTYHDYAIQLADLPATQADPRAKLFILHPEDAAGVRPDGEPATLPELRRLYPEGQLSTYPSARPDKDFLVFFVPARPDADVSAPEQP